MATIAIKDDTSNPFLKGTGAQGGGMSGGILAGGLAAGLIAGLGNIDFTGVFGQGEGKTENTNTTPLPEYTYENAIKVPERDATEALAPEGSMPNISEKEEIQPPSNIPDIEEPDEIQDVTNENVEQTLNYENYINFIKEQQQAQWEREDKIRAETQAREDTAYQRAIADMRKAGINPNLVGVQAAQSGGGITQATGLNTDILGKAIDQETAYLVKVLEQNWKGDQNDWDRFMQGLGDLMQLGGQIGMAIAISKSKKK